MSDTLQVSEVVERLEAYTTDWRARAASAVPITIAITLLRTLQSENEALRAAGEEARRALEPFAQFEALIGADARDAYVVDYAGGVYVTIGNYRLASKAHRGLEEVLGQSVDKSASEGTSSLLTRDAPTSGKGA